MGRCIDGFVDLHPKFKRDFLGRWVAGCHRDAFWMTFGAFGVRFGHVLGAGGVLWSSWGSFGVFWSRVGRFGRFGALLGRPSQHTG